MKQIIVAALTVAAIFFTLGWFICSKVAYAEGYDAGSAQRGNLSDYNVSDDKTDPDTLTVFVRNDSLIVDIIHRKYPIP